MKTVIIYYSQHHGNTKKLADAVAEHCGADIVNVLENPDIDLGEYDLIGFASGIYMGKYHQTLIEFADKNLPRGKNVFFMHTAGSPRENHNSAIKAVADEKNCNCLGTYFCKGFDTFGPFKLIGGIRKGHPTNDEIKDAELFYDSIVKSF